MLSGISSSRGQSPSPLRAWLVLGTMSLLQFFIAIDVTVVNIALPSIGTDLGVAGNSLTWVVIGYTITGGGLLMLGGRLGDLLGRRRTLLAGTTLFGVASLLAGVAPSFGVLVIARLAQGAGEAIALPAAMATIVLMFPEGPRRSRALSVWAAVASCGLVLGFALSGIITAHLGWRWIFLISVPFILTVIVAALLLVEADRPSAGGRFTVDLPGALLLTACPLLFTYAVVEAGEPGTSWWVSLAALAGAVVAAVGFVRVEARSPNPLVPLVFFANRARVRANLTTMLLSGALSTSFLLFTFYLQNRLGFAPLETGLTMLPLAVALIVASVLVPRLLGKWGARGCVLTGLGATTGAMAVIAIVTALDAGAGWLLLAMVLIAAGMGCGLVGLQYIAVSGATEEDAGMASGVQRAADQLGGASGVAVYVGIGFAPAVHTVDPFLVAAVLASAGLVVGALVMSRTSGKPESQPMAD
ncbi:DHA2 family lincomycin resistance protein-like MFS transporter [Tamaricihabitans halophyticus]|uniref:DHA2 family lincomycin resistance protein-like MFS transporter n=1 Tax=Tamaricihabitans halophyticus TaxID=1262583 RepID=A0A4R2QGY0_9PSEU|nr:MFS transporter [Tamaricihabitans halophyticus]TCP46321.1 DHA2 family lincomycin resistance protein-like MFS transporter [Tamaricihabitans halophyticus]